MKKITIDPLTRIEGHLKVVVNIENGFVVNSDVTGTMARGIEKLLIGKDPRDAVYVTERICGVCFAAHGWTASLATEIAHGTTDLPEAARILRNLIVAACWLHDHILHFYHLSAVDYLDMSVLARYSGTDTYLNKLKHLIIAELNNTPVEGEYAGPFLPVYTPDEYCINDLDTVATLVLHYLDALNVQAKAKKLSAIFGGKQPHQSGIVTGGVTQLPSLDQMNQFRILFNEITNFINNVYVKDVLNIGTGPLLSLAASNIGVGYNNYLSYGGFPETNPSYLYPEGAIVNGNLAADSRNSIEPHITEDVTKAWYQEGTGGHPSVTEQNFNLEKNGAYTFVKAPRFNGYPMEVGPLARMMVLLNRPGHRSYSHPAVTAFAGLVNQGVKPGVVARHAARALETRMLCDAMNIWLSDLESMVSSGENVIIHDTAHWDPPVNGQGYGMTEAPRGALGHWIRINNSVIDHYACVVPTTWNSSPKDAAGKCGPYEKALEGCPVPDNDNPINVGRIIRSFDPCIACAVHVIDGDRSLNKFLVP